MLHFLGPLHRGRLAEYPASAFNRDACQQSSAAAVLTEAECPRARIHFTRRGTTWLWARGIAVMMAGVILVILGAVKMATLLKFFPYPVVAEFTSGIAVIIFCGRS